MGAVAMILGLPLFFEAGVVLMMPIIMNVGARLAKDPGGLKGNPYLLAGLPVFAGIGVLHVLVPPHPGPMVAIDALKADMGGTLLLGLLMSIPVAIVAGPLFTYWAATRASASPPVDLVARLTRTDDQFRSPGIAATILTILFPILLMLGKAAVDLMLPAGHPVRTLFEFIGNPLVALLLAVILSMFTFGFFLGKDTRAVGKLLGDALPPVAAIMLIIGAGGALKQMLIDVGLGTTIAHASQLVDLSPLLLGWFTAVIIRLATGSATVATVTAAGLMAATVGNPGLNPSLLALSIGAGSMFFSHINDAGFWLVKEYMGMNLPDMFKTWSVIATIIAVMGLSARWGFSLDPSGVSPCDYLTYLTGQTFISVARCAARSPKVKASSPAWPWPLIKCAVTWRAPDSAAWMRAVSWTVTTSVRSSPKASPFRVTGFASSIVRVIRLGPSGIKARWGRNITRKPLSVSQYNVMRAGPLSASAQASIITRSIKRSGWWVTTQSWCAGAACAAPQSKIIPARTDRIMRSCSAGCGCG